MINRKEAAHFTNKELTFITYWSQNMNKNCGYGFSPVEAAIPQITYHINVEQFNARFFSQGGMTVDYCSLIRVMVLVLLG